MAQRETATIYTHPGRPARPRGRPPWGRGSLLPLAYFAVLAMILLSPALRNGKILAPIDMYYDSPLFAAERPENYVEPANPHLFDQAYQFVPWRYYAWDRLRSADIPLWNPHSASGTPFVATLQAAVFYPINLLALSVPFAVTFVFSAMLRLWIAGLATYALLRRYDASHLAGLMSGTSFMLCGFVIGWLGHPHTNVAIWLPALILAVEGLLESRGTERALRWWALLALVTGVQFLGGHIETSRDILLAAGAYAVVRTLQSSRAPLRERLVRLVGGAGSAVLTGIALAAVQLLPFLEWLPLSAEYQQRSSAGFDAFGFDPRQLVALPLAVMPNLYGNPIWSGEYWSFNPWGSYNESTLYAGLVPLALAAAALTTWRTDPVTRAWTLIGGLALALTFRLPIIDWVNQLPGMTLGHPGRLRLIAIFAVAVLAGRGLDAVQTAAYGPRARRWAARVLMVALALGASVALVFNLIFPLLSNWETRAIARYLDTFGGDESAPRSVALCGTRVEACGRELADAFRLTNWEMYLIVPVAGAGLLALCLAWRWADGRRWLVPALVGLTAFELLAVAWGYNPAVDAALLDARIPALRAAAARDADGARMTVLQTDLLPDAHTLFGLSDVRGLDFKTARYERYLDATGSRTPWIANGVLLADAGPLIQALGVRSIVTTNPHIVERETSEGSMRVDSTYGDVTLLEPTTPVARAALRFDAELAPTDSAAAGMLSADPDAIATRVILDDGPAARSALAALEGTDPDASVTPVRLDAEHLAWNVSTAVPALLVVSDLYYPGWTATIDGEPAEILRANIAFRAVLVPVGDHTVEMRYEPASFRYGAVVSATALVLILAAPALAWLLSLRRRA